MNDMSFADGFTIGSARVMAAAQRGDPFKVFDWDKAATILNERRPTLAEAGLEGDWNYTGGCIWKDGQPFTDSYTYLGSMWATPCLKINGELIPCFTTDESKGWTTDTQWPETARELLDQPVSTKFYTVTQNNSGGFFDHEPAHGIGYALCVEATNPAHAEQRLQEIVDNYPASRSCSCCGDRWSWWLEEGSEAPSLYGEPLTGGWGIPSYIHYLDGRIEPVSD